MAINYFQSWLGYESFLGKCRFGGGRFGLFAQSL
jgi:hypothetical protein